MGSKLEIMVQDLPSSKAKSLLEQFQCFFAMADEWEAKARMIVVTHESQRAEMKLARTGRLFLREKRIEIEKTRKQLKEDSLREGKAIDGIANVLKALIEPIEKYLDQQEHFEEYKKAEEDRLRQIELQKQAEIERVAREKAEAEERERQRVENERMRKELEEKNRKEREQQAEIERLKRAEADLIIESRRAKDEIERQESLLQTIMSKPPEELRFVPPADGTLMSDYSPSIGSQSTYLICPKCGHTWEEK